MLMWCSANEMVYNFFFIACQLTVFANLLIVLLSTLGTLFSFPVSFIPLFWGCPQRPIFGERSNSIENFRFGSCSGKYATEGFREWSNGTFLWKRIRSWIFLERQKQDIYRHVIPKTRMGMHLLDDMVWALKYEVLMFKLGQWKLNICHREAGTMWWVNWLLW